MLGNAMQLTNFLRDIREDYVDLGRIYMPSEDLARYGLTHEDIIFFCLTPPPSAPPLQGEEYHKWEKRKAFMQDMIARCRSMYAESMQGIQYLDPHGHQAVTLAAKLYESILDKIESKHYDIFTHSCRTSLWDKIRVLVRS
jgi:phytoene synthase